MGKQARVPATTRLVHEMPREQRAARRMQCHAVGYNSPMQTTASLRVFAIAAATGAAAAARAAA